MAQPVSFLPYLDVGRLRAALGASPARQQLDGSVPWLPIIQQVTHLWDWYRPARNATAIEMWAALNEIRLPGPAKEPWPVGGPWRVHWAIQPPDMGNLLGHHAGEVRAVATTELSGGQIAVTGGDDGMLHVWDLSTGGHYRDREPIAIGSPGDEGREIRCVATARLPNGLIVAVTGSMDGAVRVWNLRSQRSLGALFHSDAAIAAVITSVLPDERVVVTAADEAGTVRSWNLRTRQPIGRPVRCGPGMARGLSNLLVGDRMLGLATGKDSGLQMWDLTTGVPAGERLTNHPLAQQPATNTLQGSRAIAAAVLDGREIAITGNGDGLLFWDLRERRAMDRRLKGGDGVIRGLAVRRLSDRVMAVTCGNGAVQVWDLTAGAPVGELLTGHDGSVEAVAIAGAPESTVLAVSASRDKSVRIWEVPDAALAPRRPSREIGVVEAVATARSPQGQTLAVTSSHTVAQVWDMERGLELVRLTGHDSPLVSLAAAAVPDGVLVVAGHWDGRISAWRAEDGTAINPGRLGDFGPVASMATAVLADGRLVAVAGHWDGTVRAWDPVAGTRIGEPMPGHKGVVVALTTATVGAQVLVISGGEDGHVRIQDLGAHLNPGGLASRRPVDVDTGMKIASLAVGVFEAGRDAVIIGRENGTVYLLDLLDGAPLGEWRACSGAVSAVAVGQLPNGRVAVFTGGEESLVQAWDASTGESAGEALPVPGRVLSMAFQAETSSLVVGGTGVALARPRYRSR